MRLHPLLVLPAVALVLVLSAGCGGESEEVEGPTVTIAGTKVNDHGAADVDGEAEVELDDDYFEPTVLRGTPGENVTLELRNEGTRTHNFSIIRQNLDEDVGSGEGISVQVRMPQSGQLLFFCKYHIGAGMAGALEAAD